MDQASLFAVPRLEHFEKRETSIRDDRPLARRRGVRDSRRHHDGGIPVLLLAVPEYVVGAISAGSR